MAKTKRTYLVGIETKLSVQAFDVDSARKKVRTALRPGQLDNDVEVVAEPFLYHVDEDTNGSS